MADADIEIDIRASLDEGTAGKILGELKKLEVLGDETSIKIKVDLDKRSRDAVNRQLTTINNKLRFLRNGGRAHNIKLNLDKRTLKSVDTKLDELVAKVGILSASDVNVKVKADIDETSFKNADDKIDALNNKRRPLGAVIEFDTDKINKNFNAALEQQSFNVNLITVVPKTLRIDFGSEFLKIEISEEAEFLKRVRRAISNSVAKADLTDFQAFIDIDVTDIDIKGVTKETIEPKIKAKLAAAFPNTTFDAGRATLEFNSVSVTGLTKRRVDAEIRKRLLALFGTDGRTTAFDFDIKAVIQPDVVGLREKVAAAVEAGDVRDGLEFDIPINPSVNDDILVVAAAEAVQELKAILASIPEGELPTIRIIARIDRADLDDAIKRASKEKLKKLDLKVEIDRESLESELEEINKLVNRIDLTPRIRRGDLQREIAEARTLLNTGGDDYDLFVDLKVKFDRKQILAELKGTQQSFDDTFPGFNLRAIIDVDDEQVQLAGVQAARQFVLGASRAFGTTPRNNEVTSRFRIDPRLDRDSVATAELGLQELSRDRRVNVITDIRRSLRDFVTFQNVSIAALRSIAIAFGVVEAVGLAAFAAVSGATAIFAANVEEAANSSSVLFTANSDVTQSIGSASDVTQEFIDKNRELRGEILENAKVFSEDYPKSIREIAEGYFFLAGAGFSAQEATETLPVFLDFATASNLKLEEGVEQLTAVTRSFFTAQIEDAAIYGETVDDVNSSLQDQFETTSDLITQAAIRGITTVEELTKAVNNGIAGSFEQAELGGEEALEQAVTLLAVYSDVGVRGLKAGEQTQILTREIARRFIENAEAAESFLGFDPFIGEGSERRIRDFTTLIDVLAVKLRDLTPEEKQQTLIEDLGFTFKSSKALNVILGRVGTLNEQYEELIGRELTVTDALTRDLGALQREREIIAAQAPRSTRLIAEATKDSINAQTRLIVNGVQRILLDGFFGTGIFLGATSPARIITDLFEQINQEIRNGGGEIIDQFADVGFEFQDLVGRFFISFDEFIRNGSAARVFEEIVKSIENTVKAAQIFANEFRKALDIEDEDVGILELLAIGLTQITEVIIEVADDIGRLSGSVAKFIRDNEEAINDLLKVWIALFAVVTGLRFAFLPLTSLFSSRSPLGNLVSELVAATAAGDVFFRVLRNTGQVAKEAQSPVEFLTNSIKNLFETTTAASKSIGAEQAASGGLSSAIFKLEQDLRIVTNRLNVADEAFIKSTIAVDDTAAAVTRATTSLSTIDDQIFRTQALLDEVTGQFRIFSQTAQIDDLVSLDTVIANQFIDDIDELTSSLRELRREQSLLAAEESRLSQAFVQQSEAATNAARALEDLKVQQSALLREIGEADAERVRAISRQLDIETSAVRAALSQQEDILRGADELSDGFSNRFITRLRASLTTSAPIAFRQIFGRITTPARDAAGRVTSIFNKAFLDLAASEGRAGSIFRFALNSQTVRGFQILNRQLTNAAKLGRTFFSALGAVFNIVVIIVGAIKGFFDTFREGIQESERDLEGIKTVFEFIIEVLDLVLKALFRFGEAIGRLLGSITSAFLRTFGAVANFIEDFFKEGPLKAVENFVKAVGDIFRDLGANIVRAIAIPIVKLFNELNDIPGIGKVLDTIGLGKDDLDGFVKDLEEWNQETVDAVDETVKAVGDQATVLEEFIQRNNELQEAASKNLTDIADANNAIAASRQEILAAEINLVKDLDAILKDTSVTNEDSIKSRQKAFADYVESISGIQIITDAQAETATALLEGQLNALRNDREFYENVILQSDQIASTLAEAARAGDPDALAALQDIVDETNIARDKLAETNDLITESEEALTSRLENNRDLREQITLDIREANEEARKSSRFGIQGRLNLAIDTLNSELAARRLRDSFDDVRELLNSLGPEAKESLRDVAVEFQVLNKNSLLDTNEEVGALQDLLNEIAVSEVGVRLQQAFGINFTGLIDKAGDDVDALRRLLFDLGKTEVGQELLAELGLTFDEIVDIAGIKGDAAGSKWVATFNDRLNSEPIGTITNRFFESDQDTIKNIENGVQQGVRRGAKVFTEERRKAAEQLRPLESLFARDIDLVTASDAEVQAAIVRQRDVFGNLPQAQINRIFELRQFIEDVDTAIPKLIEDAEAQVEEELEASGVSIDLPATIKLPKGVAVALAEAINSIPDDPALQRSLTEFANNLQIALDNNLIEGITDIRIANDGTIEAITTDGTILGEAGAQSLVDRFELTTSEGLNDALDTISSNFNKRLAENPNIFGALNAVGGAIEDLDAAVPDPVDENDPRIARIEDAANIFNESAVVIEESSVVVSKAVDTSLTELGSALEVTFPNAVSSAKETVDRTAEAVRTQAVANRDKVTGSGRSVANWFADGLATGSTKALNGGRAMMESLKVGLSQGFGKTTDAGDAGDPTKSKTVAGLINSIDDWIFENKGPISADSQLLVPAGQAIMTGFQTGLSDGFGEIKTWVSSIGPYFASDAIPSEIKRKVTADFLIGNVKKDDQFNADVALAGLLPTGLGGEFLGTVDPTLGFLHKTQSAADTLEMAQHLAKLYNLTVTDFLRPPGTLTTSGNVSDHTFGTAADLSNGNRPTPQMDALFAATSPLLGTIFKQILYRTLVGGNHFNHVHLAWLKAAGFDQNSGKKGQRDYPGSPFEVDRAIQAAANQTGLNPNLIAAVAAAESGFNPRAVSPAGAQGLMQLMPGTAAGLGVDNPFDATQSALGGARYLQQQLRRFNNDLELALAAYNAGPANAARALTSFRETQDYIKRVKRFASQFGGFREEGGPIEPGRSYIVGEAGPELITVPTRAGSGEVISNDRVDRLIAALERLPEDSGTSGRPINITTNATDPEAVAAIIAARERSITRGIRR